MTSRLAQIQARFQQKQIQEREEKLLHLYENQQQRAFEKVSRGSAGSNTSLGQSGGGKVRQMFDERRQKAGVDRSYPLEPLRGSKSNEQIRGGSIERVKNSTSQTVIKSTVLKSGTQVQKSVSQVQKSVSQTRTKQKVVYSNNNDEGVPYEQRKLESDNLDKTFVKPHPDMLEIINNNHLSETLDNEEMPEMEFDKLEEPDAVRKLADVGGKLPSKNVTHTSEKPVKPLRNTSEKPFRKETKPIVKTTVRPAGSPQSSTSGASVQSQPSRTAASPISSPIRSVSQTMASVSKASTVKKGSPQPPQSARAPCNTRPSAKQSAKSPVARDDLNECRYCSRRFAADRLETHESICGKTTKKKRKTYDATKHRVEGTELEQYVKKGNKSTARASTKQASKKDWRRTHEEFINAIRAAKMAQAHVAKGGKLSDLPPPPPSSNPDYVQCPHCGRKFNEAAAERHIPKCASYSFNKPKLGTQTKGKIPSGRNLR